MSPVIFGLVALAAVLHVAWNVLLKTTGDPLRTSGRATAAGLVVALPLAAVAWLLDGRPGVPPEALLLAVASGLAEVVYFVFLSAAYTRGDLSLVYPIARGTAPLLAVASGVLLLGERLGPVGAAGVVSLLAGILAIRRPWGVIRPLLRRGKPQHQAEAHDRRARQAVLLALGTGVMIATYSSIDRVGTRLTEPWLYAALLWTVSAAGLWVWIGFLDRARRARVAAFPSDLPDDVAELQDGSDNTLGGGWLRAIAIGLLLLFAYLLILVAFSLAPLSAVAPLRESAVVLASGWGAIKLRESSGRREAGLRIGGAALILLGAVLLAVEG